MIDEELVKDFKFRCEKINEYIAALVEINDIVAESNGLVKELDKNPVLGGANSRLKVFMHRLDIVEEKLEDIDKNIDAIEQRAIRLQEMLSNIDDVENCCKEFAEAVAQMEACEETASAVDYSLYEGINEIEKDILHKESNPLHEIERGNERIINGLKLIVHNLQEYEAQDKSLLERLEKLENEAYGGEI